MDLDNFDETGAHAMADVPIDEDDPFAESGVVLDLAPVTSLVPATRAFSSS